MALYTNQHQALLLETSRLKKSNTNSTPVVQAAPVLQAKNNGIQTISDGINTVVGFTVDTASDFADVLVILKNLLVILVKNWQLTLIGAVALIILFKRL